MHPEYLHNEKGVFCSCDMLSVSCRIQQYKKESHENLVTVTGVAVATKKFMFFMRQSHSSPWHEKFYNFILLQPTDITL